MSLGRHLVAFTSALLVLAGTLVVVAAQGPRPPVHVVVAGDPAEARRFEEATQELLGRLGVEVSFGPTSVASGAIVVRVDLTRSDAAVVGIRSPSGEENQREVRSQGSRSVLIDESAHVVQAAVESLLSEPPAPTAVPTASAVVSLPPRRAPARASPGRPALGFDVSAFAGLHAMAPAAEAVPKAGVGLQGAYRRGRWRPGAWVLCEYRLPFDIDESGSPPRAQTLALRLLPSIDLGRGRGWLVQAGVGAGLDRFHVTHAVEDAVGHARHEAATWATPVLSGMLAFRLDVADNVQLTLLTLGDWDPAPPDLEVRRRRPGGPEEVTPWTFRPGVALGLTFTAAGAKP